MDADLPCRLRSRRAPVRRAGGVLGALALVAVLASACQSGATGPGVASIGATSSTTLAAAGPSGGPSTAHYADAVAFAQCMRAHGVANFPDPTSHGGFVAQGGRINGQSGLDPRSKSFQAATTACRHLLPNGGQMTPAQKQQAVTQVLTFVRCMRHHGVPNMPDPIVGANSIGIRVPASVGQTPQFQSAQKACGSILSKGRP